MAKLIINDEEFDLPDGSSIAEICEEVGVPFSCNDGVCGTCHVKILEGAENLCKPTQEELELGMDENNRLACQCSIKTGTVKIGF